MEFNIYTGGITNKKPTGITTLETVLDRIKTDTVLADSIGQVRAQTSKKAADFYKKDLDYVTFSGVFSPVRKAENLTKHSGLIVLDFDHLEDPAALRIQLQTDPYVLACFLSPSGKGLKLVIPINDSDRHKEAFADLAYYFNTTYNLPDKEQVDPSGSDCSRACFLSHDANVYHNPAAKLYKIQNLIPAKPKTEHEALQDVTDKERHIAAVVDRIEKHSMDICNEYGTEWLMIAFSLATIGENGRAYFHRISSQNAKYDEKATDEKFDNALKTGRFRNPAKLFSICKDYGVDVRKPKASTEKPSPADKPIAEKKTNPKKNDDEDWFPTVQYGEVTGMTIKVGKYWDNVAPNFQIFIKYRTEDEQENVTWVLEVKKEKGEPIFLEVLHDEFCSARKLKSMLATKRLGFKIKDSHLDEWQSYLFTKTSFATAMKVIRYGYHIPSGVYFFANKALNIKTGELLTPDKFGIVAANEMHLSIPQQPKARQARYTLTEQDVTFNDFFKLYATAHLYDNAFLPVCFYIFSLFRDIGLRCKNFSPILFLKGGAGTGKSSMARTLTAAFGHKQEGVNLKSKNTDAALVKLMSQTSNSIIWFDEFHNELTNEGLLQAAYDNDGYHKSTTDFNSIDTATVEIHSALALTSNYLPDNQIFFSRCVYQPIIAQQKTADQITAYDKLVEIETNGLGQMSVELLKHREILTTADQYTSAYTLLYNGLKTRCRGQNVTERLIANCAQLMAAPYLLQATGKINMLQIETRDRAEILSEFLDMAESSIMRQFRIINEGKPVAIFFEIIQGLYDQHQIFEGVHFKMNQLNINLNFPKLYNIYVQKYRQIYYKTAPDRDTIQSDLARVAGADGWESITKQIRFRSDNDQNDNGKTIPLYGCCELEYKQLQLEFGLDLR